MYPLASRARSWDSTAAEKRIRSWAGGPDPDDISWSKYGKAFFYVDPANRDKLGGYKLPYCDIINGKLMAIPRAIFAVAAVLQGARGGVQIPSSSQASIKSKVESYYNKMRSQFDDDSITAPWKVEKVFKLAGLDEDKRLVYGVVLQPDVQDLQGDICSAEAIEGACHDFMEKYQNVGLHHRGLVNKDCKIVENYIAPKNFSMGNGINSEQSVAKGSWIMAIKVYNKAIWKSIKDGTLTGLSIGGYGTRENEPEELHDKAWR